MDENTHTEFLPGDQPFEDTQGHIRWQQDSTADGELPGMADEDTEAHIHMPISVEEDVVEGVLSRSPRGSDIER